MVNAVSFLLDTYLIGDTSPRRPTELLLLQAYLALLSLCGPEVRVGLRGGWDLSLAHVSRLCFHRIPVPLRF